MSRCRVVAIDAATILASFSVFAQQRRMASDQEIWALAIDPSAEIVRSPAMTRPDTYNAMPVDADASTGSFLSDAEIGKLIRRKLFEEAGYKYHRDRLMYTPLTR